jgi:Sec-independent protein secretion pathway component TatC
MDALSQQRAVGGVTWLTLLTSGGTLICCALPALLVALGAGAVLASAVSSFPQLIWISAHKGLIFAIAGCLLAGAGVLQWYARSLPCPVDPELAKSCTRSRRVSLAVYLLAVSIFLVGAFFAYVAPWWMARG